jgi:hypothetical protein
MIVTQTHPSRFKRIYLASAGIIIASMLIGTGFTLFNLLYPSRSPDVSHPLDDKLEYLGRYEYGCNFFCGSHPSETYFYATDLTPPNLAQHLSHASLLSPSKIDNWKEKGPSFSLEFETPEVAKAFSVDFTMDGTQKVKQFNLRKTTKQYVISFDAKYYQAAKDSL